MLRYNGDESSDGVVLAVLSQTTTLESFTPRVAGYGFPLPDAHATSVLTVPGFSTITTPPHMHMHCDTRRANQISISR